MIDEQGDAKQQSPKVIVTEIEMDLFPLACFLAKVAFAAIPGAFILVAGSYALRTVALLMGATLIGLLPFVLLAVLIVFLWMSFRRTDDAPGTARQGRVAAVRFRTTYLSDKTE